MQTFGCQKLFELKFDNFGIYFLCLIFNFVYEGSIDFLELDAKTFANWTVDYIKIDACHANMTDLNEGFPLVSSFLRETKRPIVVSCSWPFYSYKEGVAPNYTHIAENCNLWRNYGDIDESFSTIADIVEWFASNYNDLYEHMRPGAWHDPDMLVVGNKDLSADYARAQMAMWSILGGPMIMSNDLREITLDLKQLLLNKNLISINQDAGGRMGKRLGFENNVQIWRRELENQSFAFVFYYPDPYSTKWTTMRFWIAIFRYLLKIPAQLRVSLRDLGLADHEYYSIHESFTGDLIGNYGRNASFSRSIDPFGGIYAFVARPFKENQKYPLS